MTIRGLVRKSIGKQIFQKTDTLSSLDLHFARFMQRLSGSDEQALFLAAASVSSQTRQGHICLELEQLQDTRFLTEKFGDQAQELSIPSLHTLESALASASVVGKPGDFTPLILDEKKRLYLHRYWKYQEILRRFVRERAPLIRDLPDASKLQQSLERYFPKNAEEERNQQKIAAAAALLKRFCVITGGPGTGKTFTVAKIITLLLEQAGSEGVRIVLAAPTGKAAMRLQDAIKQVKQQLSCRDEIKAAIPEDASTIHRLLGAIRHSPYFRYHAENPLPADVVIVDEASMVDLALMAKLVLALPTEASLILLGDENQLASVEAGAVLADMCDTVRSHPYSKEFAGKIKSFTGQQLSVESNDCLAPGIRDCIVRLQKSYRFSSREGIGALSQAVNQGDGDAALELLQDDTFAEIEWHPLKGENYFASLLQEFENYSVTDRIEDLFDRFSRFRILCAIREGPQGVNTINARIEQFVKTKLKVRQSRDFYPGQPILITQNDYHLNLFNGDLGFIFPDPGNHDELVATFPDKENKFRKLRPFRLPQYEIAYAMTVHKSQGSEFDNVLLALPERDAPILTRELIYTGITRAIQKVDIWGTEAVFRTAVSRRIQRHSGLRDALWGNDA
ncbi:MAG: exodeoxyribonuclease V subunit alpha [bacterium]